jgi:hypothetical protein
MGRPHPVGPGGVEESKGVLLYLPAPIIDLITKISHLRLLDFYEKSRTGGNTVNVLCDRKRIYAFRGE